MRIGHLPPPTYSFAKSGGSSGKSHEIPVQAPTTFRDLGFLNQAILRTKQSLTSLAPDRKRKFRSRGVS